MKQLAALAVPALAVAALLWLCRGDAAERTADRAGAAADETRRAAATAESDAPEDVPAVESPAETVTEDPNRRRVETKARLVYDGGRPAHGINLHLAVGVPIETKVFRNGDYPAKRIWLVTDHHLCRTKRDGSFAFPAVAAPPGAERILYTEPTSDAFVLARYEPLMRDVPATMRVPVTGVLRDASGEALGGHVLQAQLGRPEDWDLRTRREADGYVTSRGNLEIDPYAKVDHVTYGDGTFHLRLVPGRTTFSFGENREDGSLEVEIPPHGLDADLTVPPRPEAPRAPRSLSGVVLNCTGRPHGGAEVRLWAGNVGAPSHVTRTDVEGRFSFRGLRSERAIAWAISTRRPHLYLPSQSSGTIWLPCDTPVVLRAPDADEYGWIRLADVAGFFLFVREGVLLGGDSLGPGDEIGVPPGRYEIHVVTHEKKILAASCVIDSGGGALRMTDFEETT